MMDIGHCLKIQLSDIQGVGCEKLQEPQDCKRMEGARI